MFLDHTQRCSTVGRTPLDEWSARHRELYLTTHDTHNRQISMPPVGFEPKISAGERLQAAHLHLFINCGPCCTRHVIYCQVWATYIGLQPHSENTIGKQPTAPHLNSFKTVLTTYAVKSPSFRLPYAEIFIHL